MAVGAAKRRNAVFQFDGLAITLLNPKEKLRFIHLHSTPGWDQWKKGYVVRPENQVVGWALLATEESLVLHKRIWEKVMRWNECTHNRFSDMPCLHRCVSCAVTVASERIKDWQPNHRHHTDHTDYCTRVWLECNFPRLILNSNKAHRHRLCDCDKKDYNTWPQVGELSLVLWRRAPQTTSERSLSHT